MSQFNSDNNEKRPENESGGLFSDNYEVKRENPYVRRNREKAKRKAEEQKAYEEEMLAKSKKRTKPWEPTPPKPVEPPVPAEPELTVIEETASPVEPELTVVEEPSAPAESASPTYEDTPEPEIAAPTYEDTSEPEMSESYRPMYGYGSYANDEPSREPPPDDGTHHSAHSSFFSDHVKLITALATCFVIIALLSINDVIDWAENIQERQEQKDKIPLTLSHIRALCDRGQNITWSDMTPYVRFDVDTTEYSVTWKFKVKSTEMELWISGLDTDRNPAYVYLYDLMSGERIDLNKDNLDLFLDRIE